MLRLSSLCRICPSAHLPDDRPQLLRHAVRQDDVAPVPGPIQALYHGCLYVSSPLTVGPYMTARCLSPLGRCMISGIEDPPGSSDPDCSRRMERTGRPVDIDPIPDLVVSRLLPLIVLKPQPDSSWGDTARGARSGPLRTRWGPIVRTRRYRRNSWNRWCRIRRCPNSRFKRELMLPIHASQMGRL